MDNFLAVTKIKSISNSSDNLADLSFGSAAVKIFLVTKLSSLHELHHNVEIIRIIVNFVDLHNVWML